MNEVIHPAGTDNTLMKSAFQARAAFNIIKADMSKASNRVNFRWAERDDRFPRKSMAQKKRNPKLEFLSSVVWKWDS